MKPKILIIEDEEKLARFLELELTHEGYEVTKAFNGKSGLELSKSQTFDLLLLDILLPEMNGMEVLRRLRKEQDIPVIMLTAKDSVIDKVSGLDAGADDYITKPFAVEELLARIRNILRKKVTKHKILTSGNLCLDLSSHVVTYHGQPIELTNREFNLLHTLLENKGIVMTRETLLNQVWSYDYLGETNIVDVYIRYLRGKIDDAFQIKLIHTIRGVGYVIKNE